MRSLTVSHEQSLGTPPMLCVPVLYKDLDSRAIREREREEALFSGHIASLGHPLLLLSTASSRIEGQTLRVTKGLMVCWFDGV